MEDFKKWVQENIVFPADAKEDKVFGTVVVQFVINTSGKVVDAVIFRGVTPSLDEEARQVILSSPEWKPASQDGKKVASRWGLLRDPL